MGVYGMDGSACKAAHGSGGRGRPRPGTTLRRRVVPSPGIGRSGRAARDRRPARAPGCACVFPSRAFSHSGHSIEATCAGVSTDGARLPAGRRLDCGVWAQSQLGLAGADTLWRRGDIRGTHAMTPALSGAERAMLEGAHRQRYKLTRAPRFQPPPDPLQATAGRLAEKTSQRRLVTLPKPPFAVRVLNNMTFGATRQSIAEFNALGSSD